MAECGIDIRHAQAFPEYRNSDGSSKEADQRGEEGSAKETRRPPPWKSNKHLPEGSVF